MDFSEYTKQLTELIVSGDFESAGTLCKSFMTQTADGDYKSLCEMVLCFLVGRFDLADQQAADLRDRLACKNKLPQANSIYSIIWIDTQLKLERRQRRVTRISYEYLKGNLAVLKDVNPILADEVRRSGWPEKLVLVDFWTGLHLFDVESQQLLVLTDESLKGLEPLVRERAPLGFGGICTGQEILYCLDHPLNGVHGMQRVHYVYEKDIEMARVLLSMADLSEPLASCQLTLMAGERALEQGWEVMKTLRYPTPSIIIGDYDQGRQFFQDLEDQTQQLDRGQLISEYYRSEEFQRRQRKIAQGELMPRILVVTCRWTTFLKYCASDFYKAFEQMGCQVKFLIEENDVQYLSPMLHTKTIDDFRPDAIFMVSHARPTIQNVPEELPIIAYIQDKCGKILTLDDWRGHYSRQDFFVCLCPYLETYMQSKNIPAKQTMILPLPVDEAMYYPLPADHQDAKRFGVDISFVKHGHREVEALFEEFLAKIHGQLEQESIWGLLEPLFRWLHREVTADCDQRYYESDMWKLVRSQIKGQPTEVLLKCVQKYVASYYITIHSAAWRCHYLEALVDAGMPPALYGNDWEEHKRLGAYARGAIDRETQLKSVYNFSKINLHISQAGTMHQRLIECALSGGFMLVSDHDPQRDYCPTRPYFEEGREIVFFDTAADLVDKCQYYLEHEQERLDIAARFRQRALETMSMRNGAKKVLERWRAYMRTQLKLEPIEVINY